MMGLVLRDELARLQMLDGVAFESIEGIVEQCAMRHVGPGQVLLSAGHANATMYMILEGRLSVHLESVDSEPVAHLDVGQTVGELSVIDHSPANAYVVAREPTRLLAVDEEAFWRLIAASHEFAKNLLQLLARRMRANNFALAHNVRLCQRFEQAALGDALTGLFNRRWLDTKLPRFLQRHARGGFPLSLLMIDIDHFKHFNDTHGHAAGDLVLTAVSQVLLHNLRPADCAARHGGEEFVVVLTETPLEGACTAAERLRHAVNRCRVTLEDGVVLPPVTISIGVAQAGADEDEAALLARADAALYRAKDSGRDRVERG